MDSSLFSLYGLKDQLLTPARTDSISGLEPRVLKLAFLAWSRIFYFEIQRAPSELLLPSATKICPERLNWPGRLAGN